MNIERLLAVKEAILKNPEQYNQCWFKHPCKTQYCIGGWAIVLFSDKKIFHAYTAQQILDLDNQQAKNLFCSDKKVKKFEDIWLEDSNPVERTKLAAERIDFFIKTNGTDIEEESTPNPQ